MKHYVRLFEEWEAPEDWESPNSKDTQASGLVPEWLQYVYDYMAEDPSKYRGRIRPKFDISKWRNEITHLPRGLKIYGKLDLHDCINLRKLPEDLSFSTAYFSIDLANCENLINFPDGCKIIPGSLTLSNCKSLQSLPDGLTVNSQCDLGYCTSLTKLPDHFRTPSLDLEGCLIKDFPNNLFVSDTLYLNNCPNLARNLSVDEINDLIVSKGGCRIDQISKIDF